MVSHGLATVEPEETAMAEWGGAVNAAAAATLLPQASELLVPRRQRAG